MSLSYRKARTRTGKGRVRSEQALSTSWTGSATVEKYRAPATSGNRDGAWLNLERPGIDAKGPWERSADVIELFPDGKSPGRKRGMRSDFGGSEAGMATAEYAIATLAAVGFAGLLVVILRSDQVRGFLLSIVEQALSF